MEPAVRYNGEWYKITPKPYEPERQTQEIAWTMLREPLLKSSSAYREWYAREQKHASILYPSFRKEKHE